MKKNLLIVVVLVLSVTFSGAIGYTVGFSQKEDENSKDYLGLASLGGLDSEDLLDEISDDSVNTISVTGIGTAKAEPTIVKLELGVTTEASESFGAQEALAKNSESIEKILEALSDLGISRENIKTSHFNISPRYEYRDYRERNEIVGYRVTHMLSVEFEEIDMAGSIIDEAVANGANEINNVTFSLSEGDFDEIENIARARAAQDAREKAETIASSLGVEITGVVKVTEGSYYYDGFNRTEDFESGSTQIISPQTLTETVTLEVTFRIE